MLYILIAVIVCVLAFFLIKGFNKPTKKQNKYLVYIEGMMCAHCKAHVEKAFSEAGYSVKVDLENKSAEVLSEKEVSEDELRAIVEKAGYTFVKCE